ncbi:FAD dependent pyridine nucleotide-disulfide oxidoreductase family protein [uncultured Sporomusa sp.]|uniref:FAD dependent pyridine nucleotide-disulfide oxidoreductase family protein n=1 Tax=uncultured Sporomusa sp. TaxID=307249 RepID=A0A212LW11_9FIRM|nr:NAD(P)/FAD-dependent oxidoreductase [uncultured Sporomusa sp.]SCM81637.1 FAD dependent pyridine nucleotide-disulfide oxidoreductase family protein [uncultured Sporomusa sp.]
MSNTFDIAIIGGGPAGVFAAYELIMNNPGSKIVLVEAGHDIYSRHCPISDKKVPACIKCNPCGIMRGFGGAGAFSDGKYNFTTQFGGWLNEYLPDQKVLDLIDYVDQINIKYGAPSEYFSTQNSSLGKEALRYDLHLLDAKVRHLGTENNLKILQSIYDYLKETITMLFGVTVDSIKKVGRTFTLQTAKDGIIECDYLIAAPGRAGSEWFSHQCRDLGLSLTNNQVDVGVRVEIPAEVFQHITDDVYEAKLVYRTKQYGDLVRTFCMNPKGYVVAENTDGIVTANGHSYRDEKLHSKNTNFALLVSNHFTEPFNEPHQYGKRIASFSNMLGGGVLVQRFGDLLKGRRTNEHRLAQSFTQPTLKATPGDLSLVLPKRHLDNIIEMIYALNKIAPGMANDDTLLYGVEVKFYSSRLKLTEELETEITDMFAIGDGAGITRGLSQASASGVHVARVITERFKK